jgi:haloacetate dehalogenase
VLWSLHDDLEDLYGDVLAVWRPWIRKVHGRGLASGPHMAGEVPDELAAELKHFLMG